MKTANSTVKNMNFDTFAFSKGYLRVKNYNLDEVSDEEYFASCPELSNLIVNMQIELMRFGYMLDTKCLQALANMPEEEVEKIANSVVDYLADAYGDGCFVTLFGNYPQTVLQMSELEMFVHQIMHYLSGGTYSPAMPSCDDAELAMLHSSYDNRVLKDNYKLITPISDCDLAAYFNKLLSAQQSLTDYDKKAVEYLCNHYDELGVSFNDIFPEDIPFKETLCLVLANTGDYYPKTITDVLRYAVYLSDGDVSLPALPSLVDYGWYQDVQYNQRWNNPRYAEMKEKMKKRYEEMVKKAREPYKFAKFSRGQRRDILDLIEYVLNHNSWDNVLADMKKYMGRWIRLGEVLHPGEYAKQYPKTSEAFIMLRNSGQYISTFNGKIAACREAGDVTKMINLYKTRPGEFARNIDNLLRNYPNKTDDVLDALAAVLPSVSIKNLYELLDHFNIRNDEEFRNGRYITVKSNRKAYKLPNLAALDEVTLVQLMELLENEMLKRFSAKESLEGKTYIIDRQLADIALPKNMRSMNIAPGQLGRGTKLRIDDSTGIIRCYCRWVDKFGQYDLDLATTFYDENFQYKTAVSWNSYYKQEDWAVFSGDVRHRKGNCAEYIDVDINKALAAGNRYVIATVNDYDGGGFTKKDAWGGVMARSQMGTKGELTWAPDTITTGFRLTSTCCNIIMTVLDLKERVMYVVDEDMAGLPVATTCKDRLAEMLKRYVNEKRYFNALSLISSNIKARGGSALFVNHNELEEKKAELEGVKAKYAGLIADYKAVLSSLKEGDENSSDVLNKVLPELTKTYDALCNTQFISFEDLAADYTKLFEWMF